MIHTHKKVVEETHDEKKINVDRDFINSNFGWKILGLIYDHVFIMKHHYLYPKTLGF